MSALLEVAANSLDSALAAQAGGAGRLELCTALEIGGLTPSPGLIALARDRVTIPLFVLIRPRAGDFAYSDAECETMLRDIEHCVALGCDGVVLGALDGEGNVDLPRCRAMIASAKGLGATFHRAIDVCRDPLQALEQIIGLGFERVLSSGARARASDGAVLLRDMVQRAGDRIIVMPGAGVDAGNIRQLRDLTGAREFHASARAALPSRSHHRSDAALGMEGSEWRTDVDMVRHLVKALR